MRHCVSLLLDEVRESNKSIHPPQKEIIDNVDREQKAKLEREPLTVNMYYVISKRLIAQYLVFVDQIVCPRFLVYQGPCQYLVQGTRYSTSTWYLIGFPWENRKKQQQNVGQWIEPIERGKKLIKTD